LTVSIDVFTHKEERCFSISFGYDAKIKARIRQLKNLRYSATFRTFYVFAKEMGYRDLASALNQLGIEVKTSDALLEQLSIIDKNLVSSNTKLDVFDRRLHAYKSYLSGLRLSESSISTYSVFIVDFLKFIQGRPMETVNDTDVRLFIEQQVKRKQYSISTHRQLVSAIKHFGALFIESAIEIENIRRPYKSSYLPVVLSKEEVIEILRVTRNLKHRATLALLYSSGLRIGEVISLELSSMDVDRRQIFVRNGKGRKDRVVVMAESFVLLLKNYFMTYRPQKYFIEGQKGGMYDPGSVRSFLRKSCKIAGITKRVTPHTLRHSYATHLIEDGVGLRYVQDLLGHAKPETTMIYTHVAKKDLMNIRSPLDTALEALTRDKDSYKNRLSDNLGG
jgi:site-specific recombinase XerD